MTPEEKKRNAYLLRTHGITLDQYFLILEYQGGTCAVCPFEPDEGEWLTIDHDHGSVREQALPFVRGLLCRSCNRFVVGRHRDGQKLINAGLYIQDPPAQHVLPENLKYPKKKRQPRKRPRGKRNG